MMAVPAMLLADSLNERWWTAWGEPRPSEEDSAAGRVWSIGLDWPLLMDSVPATTDLEDLFRKLQRTWSFTADNVSIAVDIEHLLAKLQAGGIDVIDGDAVREYLRKHSDMTSAVSIFTYAASACLGKNCQFLLSVYSDPEIEDEYLRLCVRATVYDEKFMDNMDEANGIAAVTLLHCSGRILITTDFVSPG